MTEPIDFKARLAALKAQNQEKGYSLSRPVAAPPVIVPSRPASRTGGFTGDTLDDGAKAELRKLDLLGVYVQWFTPQSVRQGGNNEVNVSCFNTDFHRGGDSNPQLGFNTAKNTYYCHACNVTGDIIDLTAVKYGFANSHWQCDDRDVHEAVKDAGEELLGMTFRKTPAGYQRVPEYQPLSVSAPPPAQQASATLTLGVFAGQEVETPSLNSSPNIPGLTLGNFNGGPAMVQEHRNILPDDIELPPPAHTGAIPNAKGIELDWRAIVPDHTPLRRYMDICTADDSPEEYHFWNFMTMIGLIMGKDVGLVDSEVVFGNLLICIVGQTGVGKSRSERHLTRLISAAAPFDELSDSSKGVKVISGAGSGEYMMQQFRHEIADPRAAKGQKLPNIVHPGVRGLVKWSELSEMVGKSASTGSTVREKVMELFDAAGDISFGSISSGKSSVKNPFGSVFTTTQPERIRDLFSVKDSRSGFLNRWIFVSGIPKVIHPRGTIIDTTVLRPEIAKLQAWVGNIALKKRGLHDIQRGKPLEEFENYILTRLMQLKHQDQLYARLDLIFKKMALLLSANMMEDEVSIEAIEQAKVVTEYIIRCYESFGASLASTELSDLQEHIIEYLSFKPEGLVGYKIADGIKRQYPDKTTTLKALKELEQLGRIQLVAPPAKPGPGRKKSAVYVLEAD